MTLKEIQDKCYEIIESQNADVLVPIVLNGRLKSTLGRVCYRRTDESSSSIVATSIEFSKIYVEMASEEQINETIIHECTHYLCWYKTGKRHGHDKMFKELNKQLGGTGGRCADVPYYGAKYKMICTKCGKTIKEYYRASKYVQHPEWCISKCCKAPVKIIQNY